ncbi:YfjI family protein [Vibrio sp. 10N.222.55.C6]|uniref:YfjI family protein n=1 Tax=Vibrio sp. 10N.222.55.C6 TaxID=3229649 RepID=UPI00354EB2E1
MNDQLLQPLLMTVGETHSQRNKFNTDGLDALIQSMATPQDLTMYPPNDKGKLKEAKTKCAWFLPSDIKTSKKKDDVESHNNYTALVADVDTGNRELSAIREILSGASIKASYIYTTVSSKADDKRWRVVVPITEGIDTDHWVALQNYLTHILDGDSCVGRTQQISYKPALTVFNRESYDYHVEEGEPLDVFGSDFAIAARAYLIETLENEPPALSEPQKQYTGNQLSPIEAFNNDNEWIDLLVRYGYTQQGNRWLHPDSTSGTAGVFISYKNDPNGRYVSSHESDPLHGHSHDKFDLYVQGEHSGDLAAALRVAGDHYKTTDGLSITKHNQREHMANQEQERAGGLVWGEPQPIEGKLSPVEKFDPELLPKSLRNHVAQHAHLMDNAPVDYAAISVMVCAAGLIGNSMIISPKKFGGWNEPAILWGGVIGDPSSKKTPSLSCGLKLIRHAQNKVLKGIYARKMDEYEMSLELSAEAIAKLNEEAKALFKSGDKEGALKLKAQARESVVLKPELRAPLINDATVEAIQQLMLRNRTGVLMFRDELSGLLATMEQPNRQGDRAFLLEAFNGSGEYAQSRMGRNDIKIIDPTLSLLGGIQPAKIIPLLASREEGGGNDGMIERLTQMMVYPDFSGLEYVDIQVNEFHEMEAKLVFEGLARLGELEEKAVCKFDKQAQALWTEYATSMIERVNGADGSEKAILGKMSALCAKVALVLHAIEATKGWHEEDADRTNLNTVIKKKTLERAIKWMSYLESHTKRVTTFFKVEANLEAPRLLAERLDRFGLSFMKAELSKKDWRGLTTVEARAEAIDVLLEHGYIQEVVIPQQGKGKDKVVYYIHPKFTDE